MLSVQCAWVVMGRVGLTGLLYDVLVQRGQPKPHFRENK